MIRRLLALGALGTIGAVTADRALAARRAGGPPEPIRSFAVIDAPIDRVWSELADIEGQPRWMHEMKSVRILTPGPVGVGTRGEAEVRILGIGVTDPVSVTEFDPPHRFGIRHEGIFEGGGIIELEPGADGTTTLVSWAETLVPPVLPDLAGRAGPRARGGVAAARVSPPFARRVPARGDPPRRRHLRAVPRAFLAAPADPRPRRRRALRGGRPCLAADPPAS
jgi:uncharacterized protein YndB with AHSA1/START domain